MCRESRRLYWEGALGQRAGGCGDPGGLLPQFTVLGFVVKG